MADRDVEVDITANDKTAAGTRSAARNFDDLDRKTRSSSKKSVTQLEKDAKKSTKVFDHLFGDMVGKAKKAGLLAGDAAVDSIGSAFKALPPEVKLGLGAALTAGAIAATPAVVAAIDSAILLGLGAGGIAAGLALIAKDEDVKKAYGDLGSGIGRQLEESVIPFKAQAIGAAGDLARSFTAVEPRIQRVFANLSTTVRPLAQGLGKALENAAPGLEHAFAASVPLVQDLAHWLPQLGKEVGDFADAVGDAGPEAEMFFKFLLGFIDQALAAMTFLSRTTAELGNALGAKSKSLQPLKKDADETKESFKSLADTFEDFISQINSAPATIDNVAQAMTDKIINTTLSMDRATLGYAQSLTSLDDAFKENGRQLDIHTKKGQANREAVLSSVEANLREYDTMINAGASAQDAAAKYDQNTAALERQLRKAGLTQAQVDDLIGAYKGVPKNVNTAIAVQGLTKAIEDLNETLRLINHLPSNKTVTVTTYFKTVGKPYVQNSGNSRPNSPGSAYSGIDGWRPAQFAQAFAAAGSLATQDRAGGGRTQPPVQVHNDVNATIVIDGAPVRAIAKQVATDENKRQVWRDRVGRR